jgi:LPS-assembly protein
MIRSAVGSGNGMLRASLCVVLLLLVGGALPASAQVTIAGWEIKAYRHEQLEEKHGLLLGSVEIEQVGGDTKLFADEVEVFEGDDTVLARGNVVLTQANNRIAADHAEFNTKTHRGTFHTASGIASIQPRRQTPQPGGIIVPQAIGQDNDVYFFGEVIEKIGVKKYKITNGGFSTCVQPTPRWMLSADTVLLNVDHYTFLHQAIFKVKDVPMLYVPWFYYPTQEDGRATGFLLPTYSQSNIDGPSIHNAFFWAINRSMDATVSHDYLSRTGGRVGTEYRYNFGATADGAITASGLDTRAGEFLQSNGQVITRDASRSYVARGGANQLFPGRLRARATVDYFSSVVTNQIYNTNPYFAAQNRRTYGANVIGGWRSYSLNATYDRTEQFSSATNSFLQGRSPGIMFARNERPLFARSPLYVSVNAEAVHLDSRTNNNGDITDLSTGRFDVRPQIRYPFKKWQWFTVNTAATLRDTYYTRSTDPITHDTVDANFNRRYVGVSVQAIGPVLTRVWDTPERNYAERFKHSIEPNLTIERTSSSFDVERIPKIDPSDTVVGTTTVTYALNNRLYA